MLSTHATLIGIYLVGAVVTFLIVRHYFQSRKQKRKTLGAQLVIMWPVAAAILMMLAIEAVVDWFYEGIHND